MLSNDDKITVFTMLGIPVTTPSDFYQDLSSKETVNRNALLWVSQYSYLDYPYQYSKDAIDAVIARINALTPEEETRVADLIEQWKAIEFSVVRVKTDKVSLNYEEQRALLKRLLLIIIPINVVGGISQTNPMVSIG